MSDYATPILRAYEMAYFEIGKNHPYAGFVTIEDMNSPEFFSGADVSIFHKPNCPDIIRVHWIERRMTEYFYLTNYAEIKDRYPEKVGELEQNGVRYYKQRLAAWLRAIGEKNCKICDEALLASTDAKGVPQF